LSASRRLAQVEDYRVSDKPKPFQIKPEGPLEITISPDGSVSANSEGALELNFDKIKSVGVENIIDVETYSITRVARSTSHFVKFFGGGEVILAYSDQGRILDFSTKDVQLAVAGGDKLMIRRKTSAGA
jgi:hypothetical protein